jgi:hypothetical protein
MKLPISTIARWTARIVGTLILPLIVALAICEGVPNPFALSIRETLLFIALVTMIVGQIAAWKWEGIGGLLILSGFAFFAVVDGRIPFNIVFGPWLLTGLLYLACGWRKSRAASLSSPSQSTAFGSSRLRADVRGGLMDLGCGEKSKSPRVSWLHVTPPMVNRIQLS